MQCIRIADGLPMHIAAIIVAACTAVPPPSSPYNEAGRLLFDSIRRVESGALRNPERATGDSGRAIGPYQIWRTYWADAIAYDPSIGGTYEDCRSAAYAERVMVAYWSRYAPDWKPQTLARIHNGGPQGHKHSKTLQYWNRVNALMR